MGCKQRFEDMADSGGGGGGGGDDGDKDRRLGVRAADQINQGDKQIRRQQSPKEIESILKVRSADITDNASQNDMTGLQKVGTLLTSWRRADKTAKPRTASSFKGNTRNKEKKRVSIIDRNSG